MIRTLAAALATSTCLVALATPASAQTREFNVPAGSLRTALDAFARQSGRQVIYRGDVRSARSPGVSGAHTAEDALNAILAGSGFVVKTDRSGAFAIVKAGNVSPARTGASSVEGSLGSGQATSGSVAADAESVSEEIVVTGTNIRGVKNITVPLQSYSKEDLDRSGYSSTQQFIESIPQNFKGGGNGASEDGNFGNGSLKASNLSGVTSPNLRGLGNASTLTLLNGRRLAPAANGQAVDISTIPLAAIERVDVLADGSSAIYGSDAVAGVINFVLRRDYDGAESRASISQAHGGEATEVVLNQSIGRAWQTGGVLLNGSFRHRDALRASERQASAGALQPNDILPNTEGYGFLATGHQVLGSGVEVFADALYNRNRGARNVTTAAAREFYDWTDRSYYVSGGLTAKLSQRWKLDVSASYSDDRVERTVITNNPPAGFVSGDILNRSLFNLFSADAKIDGSLLNLPGGPLSLAAGVSYREESSKALILYNRTRDRLADRNVLAEFVELYAPVVGPDNAIPLIDRLIVSLALRHDRYSDVGHTTNYKAGLGWSPFGGLTLRASQSSSFRAPTVLERALSGQGSFIIPFVVDSPAGGSETILFLTGSGGALTPETAKTFNLGFEVKSRLIPNLNLSLDYYNVIYSDRIDTPPFVTNQLLNPGVYGGLISSFPNDASVTSFVNASIANGVQVFGPITPGIRFSYDLRLRNVAVVKQSGIDLVASYHRKLGSGDAFVSLNVGYIDHIETGYTGASNLANLLNIVGAPTRWRGRAQAGWKGRNWSLNGAVNYRNSYRDTTVTPEGRISSWATFDANITLEPERWDGLSLRIGAVNLFNAGPPLIGGFGGFTGVKYDVANANPLGRLLSLEIRKRW